MRTLFILSLLSITILSCAKEPVEPSPEPPFSFKPKGIVVYAIQAACNGYPIEFIDGGGNIDNKVILTSKWSTSFPRSKGDSVRIGLSCTFDEYPLDLEDYEMISRITYQSQLVFSDTLKISDIGEPYIYSITSLGVLP